MKGRVMQQVIEQVFLAISNIWGQNIHQGSSALSEVEYQLGLL